MIIVTHLNLELKNPSDYDSLDIDQKNYIFDYLDDGKLLFVAPEHISEKNALFAYKVGFLNELLSIVYGDKYVNHEKHKIISNKYYMFNTYRTYSSQIKLYQELFR